MPGFIAMDQSFDLLIGEWHEFADQRPEEIEGRFASDGRELLGRILREAIGGAPVGDFSSSSEFAQYVIDLRANERAWSRHLGDAIVAAQSWLDQGNPEAAEQVFDEFETECPWQMFVDIARIQRLNTLGSGGSGDDKRQAED